MFNAQSARILYIEDDLITAARVQALLDQKGYIVELANNGKEGFAKINTGGCDVVIIDYQLPDIDGLQILEKMRGLKLPSIMVTGAGDERIAVEAMRLGVGDYLIKDITCNFFSLLPSAIQRVLEKQKLSEEKDVVEASMHQRETILRAVNFAAEKLLVTDHWQDHIQSVLKQLGEATAVSRVHVFENRCLELPDNQIENIIPLDAKKPPLVMHQRYVWIASSTNSSTSKLDGRCYCQRLPRWQQMLSQGQSIYGLVTDFPEPEAYLLAKQAILATAIIPIFVDHAWWGFLSFEDFYQARQWSVVVIETLKIFADTLGIAIGREKIKRVWLDQALQDKKYHTIINLSSEGFCLIEPIHKTILEVNARFCQMLGYTEQELLGTNFSNLIFQENIPPLLIPTTSVHATEHYTTEVMLKHKTGVSIYTYLNLTTAYNTQKQATSAFAFITDISTQKQTEIKLIQTISEQRSILNNSMVGIALVCSEQRLCRLNKKMAEIFGYTKEELKKEKTDCLYPSTTDYHKIAQDISRSFRKGATYTTERLMKRKNGELFWTRMFSQCIDLDDPLKGYIWTIEDITERKHADENLQLAATIFETVSEAIFVTDAENRILMVNPAFSLITGYKEFEVLGRNPKILSSGRHNREFYRQMWQCLLEEGHWQGEIWNRRRNGEVYPEWLSITTIKEDETGLKQHVAIFSDITKRKQDEAIIQHQANFDALTDLPNRTLFMDRLTQELHHATRRKSRLALMFIDLDHFKWVNDNLGHSAGDALLQQVSTRLKACVRAADTVARLGGDEFTVIVPGIDSIWHIKVIAERILDQLTEAFILEGQEASISGSIGIALFPQDGQDVDTLIKNADLAMFHAKKGGRSAYQFFTKQMNTQISEQRRLEKKLRGALEREEMVLHYQPFFDLQSEQIVGVEALLRWQTPEGELWFPKQFINLAEDIGLMTPIAQWSLTVALKQLKIWHSAGFPTLQIAVNLSTRQFKSHKTYEVLSELLKNQPFPPHCIIIEVTEQLLLDDLNENIKRIKKLIDLGVKISIDDFGSEYSSLQHIRHFPFNFLKIAPSFTKNPTTDIYGAALSEATITVAHKLNVKVIGEGVETGEQVAFLQKQCCDMVQGNFFSKPLSADHFSSFMQAWRKGLSMGDLQSG